MSTVSIAAGIGSTIGVGAQATWGGTLATISRWPTIKSATATWNIMEVQGGPYLRGASAGGDLASARLALLEMSSSTSGPIAKGTLSGDFVNTGMALWLAGGLGTAATMTQLSTTTAYQLGGSAGTNIGDPVGNAVFFDMQWGVPSTDGTVNVFTFHSCCITSTTLVFDTKGLVTYSYDFVAAFVENTTTLTAVTQPGGPVPFSRVGGVFEAGVIGSEAAVDGIKKATLKIARKQAELEERLYWGEATADSPVTSDNWKVTIALDTDYTAQAKAIYQMFPAGTNKSFIIGSSGNAIGSSGHNDTLEFNPKCCVVSSGGEPNPKGPGIITNTVNLTALVDAAADSQLACTYISADTGF